MEINREKALVNQFHFDARNFEWEKENGAPETRFHVDFQLLEKNEEDNRTSIVAALQYMLVLDHFVISGMMTQLDHIMGRIINEPTDFSEEEKRELALPLLDMLKRLTYEVTEIAFDEPGINLEF